MILALVPSVPHLARVLQLTHSEVHFQLLLHKSRKVVILRWRKQDLVLVSLDADLCLLTRVLLFKHAFEVREIEASPVHGIDDLNLGPRPGELVTLLQLQVVEEVTV